MMYFRHKCKEIWTVPFDDIDFRVYRQVIFLVMFRRKEGDIVRWDAILIYHPSRLTKPLDEVISDCQGLAKEIDDRGFAGREKIRRNLAINPNYLKELYRVEREEWDEDEGGFGFGGDWWKR